jgi:hypothetical protein
MTHVGEDKKKYALCSCMMHALAAKNTLRVLTKRKQSRLEHISGGQIFLKNDISC